MNHALQFITVTATHRKKKTPRRLNKFVRLLLTVMLSTGNNRARIRIQCKRIIQGILRAIDGFAGESRSQDTTNLVQ